MVKAISIEVPTTAAALSALANQFNDLRTSAIRHAFANMLGGMACEHGYIALEGKVWRFNGEQLTRHYERGQCPDCEQAAESTTPVCIAWQTDVMPVPAFTYGHQGCLLAKGGWPNQSIRVLIEGETVTRVCQMCGELLFPDEDEPLVYDAQVGYITREDAGRSSDTTNDEIDESLAMRQARERTSIVNKETEITLLHIINDEQAWNDVQVFLMQDEHKPIEVALEQFVVEELRMPEDYYQEIDRIGEVSNYGAIDWQEVTRQVIEVEEKGA